MRLTASINRQLDLLDDRIVGTTNSATHRKLIQKTLSKFRIKVQVRKHHTLPKSSIEVSGEYYYWRSTNNTCIFLIYQSLRTKITKQKWKDLKFRLSQAIQHELIHRDQYSYMTHPKFQWEDHHVKIMANKVPISNPAKLRDQIYLGAVDEIAAHAHDIMLELQYTCPESNFIEKLKNYGKLSCGESPTLHDYFKTFDYDTHHPAIRRLMKNLVRWIEREHIGYESTPQIFANSRAHSRGAGQIGTYR